MRHLEKQNQTLRDMEENALPLEQQQKVRGGTDDGGQVTNNSDDADVDETEGIGGTSRANAVALLVSD
jgi:hypothetical protein